MRARGRSLPLIMFVSSVDYMRKIIFVALLFLLSLTASGHSVEEYTRTEPVEYLPFDPFTAAVYVFAFVLVISVYSIFSQNSLSEKSKKIIFVAVSLPVVLVTIYMAGSTVYLNLVSESGGPVHWHADFEVWVCGEHVVNLKQAVFPSNKVGSPVFHHHDDFRVHVEGLIIKTRDVDLQQFFRVIGGDFTGGSLKLELSDGSFLEKSNGQICQDGKPGSWRLFVKNWGTGEFEEKTELEHYVIKPYFNVPPGDFFKLVFDSGEGVPNGG